MFYPVMMLKFIDSKKAVTPDLMSLALENGTLRASKFKVVNVIKIEEYEAEGVIYLFELENGSTLCLRGQYLYNACESGRFPAVSIDVYWNHSDGSTYGVIADDSKLGVIRTFPPLSEKQLASGIIPSDRAVSKFSLENFIDSLERNA